MIRQLAPTVRDLLPGRGRSDSMTGNALGMVAGRTAAMGFGFVFWLVAAHVATAAQVGFAAAVVSAMMLCTQFAQLGVGSAFISLSPAHRHRPGLLLDVALTMTAVGSLLVAAAFLVVARSWLPELGRVSRSPAWTLAFLAMSVAGTVGIVLDQVNVGLDRGIQVVTRTSAFGALTLVPLVGLPLAGMRMTSLRLFSFWVAAGIGATLVGLWQLWRTTPAASTGAVALEGAGQRRNGYRYRPRWEPTLVRRMATVGVANHLLTLCERVPGLVLPVVVTELLSAEANAVWYIVWMSAWVVFTAPVSVGIALFAEASKQPQSAAQATRTALRVCLLYAGSGALVLAVLADPVLRLLGHRYAEAGVTPLRALLLGVLPLAVVSSYYARCRASGRLGEAIAAAALGGVAAVAVPAAVGLRHGLTGMALAWVGVEALVACWAGVRLWTARR